MTQEILFQEGAIEVGALVLARGLGLDVASLHEFMREGKITNLRERGVDNDLALHRPTFFNGNRRLRLVVGQAGTSSGSQRRLRRRPSARRNAQTRAVTASPITFLVSSRACSVKGRRRYCLADRIRAMITENLMEGLLPDADDRLVIRSVRVVEI